MKVLEVQDLSFEYRTDKIIEDINFELQQGQILGIIGPNGSGKSTLLKLISNILPYQQGKIKLFNKNLINYKRKELAKRMAVLPQNTQIDFDFKAREIVEMGRYPYINYWRGLSQEDHRIVNQALAMTNIFDLVEKRIKNISGGERQRVLLARALAQDPSLLLLDEPTAALDINYQLEIFKILEKLVTKKVTVVIVLHDLNLASQYCDRLILLKEGTIHKEGSPQEVITTANIEDVYGCKVNVDNSRARPYLRIISQ